MPSLDHEILVELFRQRPELVREVLTACTLIHLPGKVAQHSSVDFSQIAPTEYRADAFVVLSDAQGAAVCAVVVEVQLAIDHTKYFTWPAYVTNARASIRCDVILLVITRDPTVARWARQSIDLGHPGFELRPVVVDLPEVPRIVDADLAHVSPEFAVLSALAHPDRVVAEAALGAIRSMPEDARKLYSQAILAQLPEPARGDLETLMDLWDKYKPLFEQHYYERGLREGREEGREEGGTAASREALRTFLVTRFGGVTDDQQARITAADSEQLSRWIARAAHGSSAEAVLAD